MHDQAAYRVKRLNYELENTRALWNDEGKAAIESYIKDGNVERFIEKGANLFDPTEMKVNAERKVLEGYCNDILSITTICFYGANPTFENTVYRLNYFLNWILDNPKKRGFSRHLSGERVPTIEERSYISNFCYGLYSMSYCFTKEDWKRLIEWLYGETFSPSRIVPLDLTSPDWLPKLMKEDKYSINMEVASILMHLKLYLILEDNSDFDYIYSYYEPLLKYIPHVFNYISSECFELKLYDRKHEDDLGIQTKFSVCQHRIAGSLAHAYYDYSDVEYRDIKKVQQFRELISSVELTPEHMKLKQFIQENGDNLRSARRAL